MAVSQIVQTNLFYAGFLAPTDHFMAQIVLCYRKNSAGFIRTINLSEVVLQFLTQKLGKLDRSIALGRFGFCNEVLLVNSLVGLIDDWE